VVTDLSALALKENNGAKNSSSKTRHSNITGRPVNTSEERAGEKPPAVQHY